MLRRICILFTAVLVASVSALSVVRAQPYYERSLCSNVPGVWHWFSNDDVYFYPNGHLQGSTVGGSWVCARGRMIISWNSGNTDRVRISSSGTYMSGVNQVGTHIWGRRIGGL